MGLNHRPRPLSGRDLVLQQLTRSRRLPKYAEVVKDIATCGLGTNFCPELPTSGLPTIHPLPHLSIHGIPRINFGAPFLCVDLEIPAGPREENAPNIAKWLYLLQSDNRAVFTATAHTPHAADFINRFNGKDADAGTDNW